MSQANVKGKKTFIGYADRIDYTEEMSLEEMGMLFKAILDFQNGKEIGDMGTLKFVWSKIRNELNMDKEKYETICEQNSKKGKGHTGNQYTQGDEKRKSNDKAQNNGVEQMEQVSQNGTNGTHSDSDYKEKEIDKSISKKIPTVSELVGAYESSELLVQQIGDSGVVRERAEYKQAKKSRAYKTEGGFTQQLTIIVNTIRHGQPRGDVARRFMFAINQAREHERKGIFWNDQTETEYQYWKKTLAFNQKQNEGTDR